MAKVAEYKKEIVKNIVHLINQYPIIAAINMENLPAPQLQKMRAELRGEVVMTMTKRRIIRIAFKEAEKTKKGIEQLGQYLEGMPALIFTKDNPFRLCKILQKSKSPAPAKANQTAPRDIVIPAGPTSFSPGPIIGELAQAGIKAGVEGGKVAIKQDSVVAKKGEKINARVAEILTRLGIQPMEVGLDLVAAYENGVIYSRDILSIDENIFMGNLRSAAVNSFNVAIFISYPTKSTIKHLISMAANDARAIGVSQNIIDEGIVEILIGKAERGMIGLKNAANINIDVPEKAKVEKKAELKEVPKEKIAETKTIKEKEEQLIEEEKKILEEEEKLEKQQPTASSFEDEVQNGVKEEEEKQLENERIQKEKELEKLEQEEANAKAKEDATARKVAEMVAKTKLIGKEPTAKQLVEEVKKELMQEPPTIQNIMKMKEKLDKKTEIETAEQLFEKLKKKGTLR